jgi:hypothetical protein
VTDPDAVLSRTLGNAKVLHLQPDDVLVFSNAGDLGAEPEDLERIKALFGDRMIVVFHGPVEVERLRDIAPCEACEERQREEAEATEQRKQEFMARHGLTELAEGGLVKGPGRPIGDAGGIDCVFPISADIVRAANPGPHIDPEAVLSALADLEDDEE